MTTTPIGPAAPVAPVIVDAMALRMLGAVDSAHVPASAPAAPAAPGAAPTAPAPPTAVETAMQSAASRQGGLAPLLADLAVAVQTPDLPAPVLAAAVRVLALQQPLEASPSADDLKQALAQSGLMLEARIAADGAPPDADLKAALLVLRQTLQNATPAPPPSQAAPPPPPPYRGGPVQAQPPAASELAANASAEVVAQQLSHGTDAALARQTLLQLASVPGSPQAPGAAPPQWMFEIPFAAAPGAAIAQFEIGRDDEEKTAPHADATPVWRARFSLDLDPMGPVHAKISLSGGRARVTLWAENGATAAKLSEQQDALAQALLGDDLVASIAVFPGAPAQAAPSAGQFVDRAL
jgi:hypothetical protein